MVHNVEIRISRSQKIESTNLLHVSRDSMFWRFRSLLTWLLKDAEQSVRERKFY